MALEVGSRLGPYEVTTKIGEGGMGEVYRARDTTLDRDVALKVLPQAFTEDPDRLARFEREAKVLASLNHPGIAGIYGLEESGDTRALVLELVEGPTLADRIAKGPIPIDEALPIAKQIAEALEAAHEAGVIHRDLKPANIKVRDDGTVKVLDFGLAKALDPTPEGDPSQSPTLTAAATQMGVIMGTAAYMSPEQARGKPADKRADIWAFGAVLFEMLTGRRAFEGSDLSTTLARVIEREADWSALSRAMPPAIQRLLRRCLRKERGRRLADIADALLEIEEATTASAVLPGVAGAGWWKPLALGASALAVLTITLALWSATGQVPAPPRGQTAVAITPPTDALIDPVMGLAVAPDGRSVVFGGTDGRLYRRALDELDAEPILGTSGVYMPFHSPDGQWVGYIDRTDNMLKKVRLDGGQPITLCPIVSVLRSARWRADQTIIFSYVRSSGLWRVSDDGGEPSPAFPSSDGEGAGESTLRWIDLLPDGSAVVASVGGSDTESRVVLVDIDTGEQQILFPGSTARYAASGHIVYWRQGALWAVPFDDERRAVTGTAAPVLEGVAFDALTQQAHFALGGSTLLYVREGEVAAATLVWVDQDGNEEVVEAEPRAYGSVQLSPDGRRVVASISVDTGNRDVFTYDLSRKTFGRLTTTPGSELSPIWSPDGSQVAYGADGRVVVERADGIGDPRPIMTSDDQSRPLSFSPDGNVTVVGRSHPDTGFDIGVVSGDSTVVDWVLAEPHNELHPKVSPDGRWIAYVSEESGSAEVYVRPFPNVEDGRWLISGDGGVSPLWGADSRELFFLTGSGSNAVVMAVELKTEQGFAADSPRPLFSGPYRVPIPTRSPTWDIMPDGDRFLMLKDAATSATTTSVVATLNWTEELKRLVPTE